MGEELAQYREEWNASMATANQFITFMLPGGQHYSASPVIWHFVDTDMIDMH